MGRDLSVAVDGETPLRVTSRSGSITVTGENRDDVLVERGKADVEQRAGTICVSADSGALSVRCPTGIDVVVGTESGSVSLHGRLGDTRATTQSGSITVDHVDRVDARTGSGSITVDECEGECRAQTKSGDLRVGRASLVELATASGSVHADAVTAARVHAGSGSVDIGLTAPGDVVVEAHSGHVEVLVPPGTRPATDLRATSGSVRCDCERGSDGSISVTVGSGSIAVAER